MGGTGGTKMSSDGVRRMAPGANTVSKSQAARIASQTREALGDREPEKRMPQIPDRMVRLESSLESLRSTSGELRERLSQYLRPPCEAASKVGDGAEGNLAEATIDLDGKLYVVEQIQTILNDILSRLEV